MGMALLMGLLIFMALFHPKMLSVGAEVLGPNYLGAYGWASLVGIILQVVVHEVGTLLTAWWLGLPLHFRLFGFGANATAILEYLPRRPWIDAKLGFAGPLTGTAVSLVLTGIFALTNNPDQPQIMAPFFLGMACVGFFYNLFTLIPILDLEGGWIAPAIAPQAWLFGLVLLVLELTHGFNLALLGVVCFGLPRLILLITARAPQVDMVCTHRQRADRQFRLFYPGLSPRLARDLDVRKPARPRPRRDGGLESPCHPEAVSDRRPQGQLRRSSAVIDRCYRAVAEFVDSRLLSAPASAHDRRMNVNLLDLKAQNGALEPELREAFLRVLRSGHFILGPEVEKFERVLAEFTGAKYALGVSSGTDAILLALMALDIGPGDEVLCPSFTFFATAGCVSRVGAKPVFVDSCPVCFNLDLRDAAKRITPRTKAILPVHLFGQMADMDGVLNLASKHGLRVIEDAAQAMGATYHGKQAGTMGDFGTISFFPTKNLGALGDAGALLTNDAALFAKAKILRLHGMDPKYYHQVVGGNFRLDALQAAMLSVKLPHFNDYTAARRRNATLYTERLSKLPGVRDRAARKLRLCPGRQREGKRPSRFAGCLSAQRPHLESVHTACHRPRRARCLPCPSHCQRHRLRNLLSPPPARASLLRRLGLQARRLPLGPPPRQRSHQPPHLSRNSS